MVDGALQLGTLGRRGIVTYPCRDWTMGAPTGDVNGECDREYGNVRNKLLGSVPYIGEWIGDWRPWIIGGLVYSGIVEV